MNLNELEIPPAERLTPEARVESLIRRLFLGLVVNNDALEVTKESSRGLTEFFVRGSVIDHPRLLGIKGQHFKAVQTIVECAGKKLGRPMMLVTVLDPVARTNDAPLPPYKYRADWPKEQIQALMDEVCGYCFKHEVLITMKESNERARFQVTCHADEPAMNIERVTRPQGHGAKGAFQALFGSMGQCNGCLVVVDVEKQTKGLRAS